jgi:HSP20 family protein
MLTRWNPMRELDTMRTMMDRLFDDSFMGPQLTWERASRWDLALDVAENEDHFIVKASVPGVAPDDLDITLTDNVLTIRGEVAGDNEIAHDRYHLRERRYGQFMRSVTLPTAVDSDNVSATCENGILALHVPKAEEVKPRRITIQNGHDKDEGKKNGQRVIEGETTQAR